MASRPTSGKKARLLGVLVALALCVVAWGGPVLAFPPPPYSVYGTITSNGIPAPDGRTVTAWCDGVATALATTTTNSSNGPGTYYFDVRGDDSDAAGKDGAYPGDIITFKLTGTNGVVYTAQQTGIWSNAEPFYQIDLTFAPLAVDLTSFSAEVNTSKVAVQWQTASETDVLGFNLYRGAAANAFAEGATVKLNAKLIASRSTTPGQGAAYKYVDPLVAPGAKYFYWVEEVKAASTEIYGPVIATVTGAEPSGPAVQ